MQVRKRATEEGRQEFDRSFHAVFEAYQQGELVGNVDFGYVPIYSLTPRDIWSPKLPWVTILLSLLAQGTLLETTASTVHPLMWNGERLCGLYQGFVLNCINSQKTDSTYFAFLAGFRQAHFMPFECLVLYYEFRLAGGGLATGREIGGAAPMVADPVLAHRDLLESKAPAVFDRVRFR